MILIYVESRQRALTDLKKKKKGDGKVKKHEAKERDEVYGRVGGSIYFIFTLPTFEILKKEAHTELSRPELLRLDVQRSKSDFRTSSKVVNSWRGAKIPFLLHLLTSRKQNKCHCLPPNVCL